MPELPEVESARAVIARWALGRRITEVDDTDTYVCRPHRPGEIRAALVGRRLSAVHRRGKSMWCETSPIARSQTPGPVLGIHLGMSGKIVFGDGRGREIDGGDYWERGRATGDHRFARFSLTFADNAVARLRSSEPRLLATAGHAGATSSLSPFLMLVDPRRFGRVRLDPPVEALGPDALGITPAQFRTA